MRCGRKVYLCEVIFLGLQSPISLNLVLEKVQLGSSRARNKASVQSFQSMVELSPEQHWANFSLLIHCVWDPCGLSHVGECKA